MNISILETLRSADLVGCLNVFLGAGFSTSDSLKDICEEDFDALGIKLGHRRRLQRELLSQGGKSTDFSVVPLHHTSDPALIPTPKRGYRRHPKRDINAPLKPLSGYASFANHARAHVDNKKVSFPQLAKRIGHQWQSLPPEDRTQWQLDAVINKKTYTKKLDLYMGTANYQNYEHYLKDFKFKAAPCIVRGKPRKDSFKESSATPIPDHPEAISDLERYLSPSHALLCDVVGGETCQRCGLKPCVYSSRKSSLSRSPPQTYKSPDTATRGVSYLPSQASNSPQTILNKSCLRASQMSSELEFGLVRCLPRDLNTHQSEDVADPPSVGFLWTTITSDLAFIEQITKLYFAWENPNFSTLSEKAFLADFRSGGDVYCSAALVNAILALGCGLSTQPVFPKITDGPIIAGDQFYAEAKRLLDEERVPQLTTIQAMSILSIRDAMCDRQNTSIFFSKKSIRLAVDMHHLMESDSAQKINDEVTLAAFWGVFALDQMWSLLTGHLPFCSNDSPYVSTLRMCGIAQVTTTKSITLFHNEAQNCFRKLSLLVHFSFHAFQSQDNRQLTPEVRLLYEDYIAWYSGLPDDLRFGLHFTPSIIFTQSVFFFSRAPYAFARILICAHLSTTIVFGKLIKE